MITGPSIGPAMVLNVLMRWPALIVVCALGGVGAIVYDQIGGDEITYKVKEFAVETGLMKAEQFAEAAKNAKVIPAAQAAVNDSSMGHQQQELVATPAAASAPASAASGP